MKAKVKFVMASLALLAGCDSRDLSERYRVEDHDTVDSSEYYNNLPPGYIHDTTVRFVAVEAEKGYDWQRDTLAGVFRGKLTMYRNLEPELVLEISPRNEISPDYGTHFIIEGKLYTYYYTESVSVVKCNGREVMRSREREMLKGVLPTDDGVLTLSQRMYAPEFIVRLDGNEVMRFEADAVFGSMEDDSYPLSGALYKDGEDSYFCYRSTVAGGNAYYIVENLKERVLTPPFDLRDYEIKDIKMDCGNINYFTVYQAKYACLFRNGAAEQLSGASGLEIYYDGRVLSNRATTTATGNFSKPLSSRGRTMFFNQPQKKGRSLFWDGFIIPGTGDAHCLLYYGTGDYLLVYSEPGGGPRIGNGDYCFSRRSTSCIENCVYLAFTPKAADEKPYIWKSEGDTTQINVKNGYLTSLTAVDSVTTVPGGSRQD